MRCGKYREMYGEEAFDMCYGMKRVCTKRVCYEMCTEVGGMILTSFNRLKHASGMVYAFKSKSLQPILS